MVQVNRWDSDFYRLFLKAVGERRQEILEELATGLDREQYLRSIGLINGLEEVTSIANDINKRMNKE